MARRLLLAGPLRLGLALVTLLPGSLTFLPSAASADDAPGVSGVSQDEVLALVGGSALTRRDLYLRLAVRHFGGPVGEEARKQTIEKYLVRREMTRRNLAVTPAEIDDRVRRLDAEVVSRSGGKSSLAQELARNEVTLESFKQQLRFLVGLEKMARQDFELAPDGPVPSVKLNLWLQDLRDAATIEAVDTGPLVAGENLAFVKVDGHPLTLAELGAELEANLPPDDVMRDLKALAGCRVIEEALTRLGLQVGPDDFEEEIERRREAMSRKSGLEDVSYESVLEQTRGMTLEQLLRDEEFVSQVGLKKIVAAQYEGDGLKTYFEENRDRFGRKVRVRHLLVGARESGEPYQTSGRTFEEARAEIEAIRSRMREDPTLSFTELIRNHSDDRKSPGGELGPFPRDNPLGSGFFDRAWELDPGEISEPVRTPVGYHLLQLVEKKEAPELEEVREDLWSALMKEVYRNLWDAGNVEILMGREGSPDGGGGSATTRSPVEDGR